MATQLALSDREGHALMERREVTPMELLQIATSEGADIEKLKALMELQERWEANQARKAYYAAMKRFKDSPPKITKNGKGHNDAKYTTLDHACAQIIPALAAVGITHKWNIKAADGKVSVSCVLTHELGFSDPEPPVIEDVGDTSGNKSRIQAIGSSIKYMERYTLFAAAGLDDGSPDNDGAGPKMSDERFIEFQEQIENAPQQKLQQVFATAYKEAKALKDDNTMKQLVKVYEGRKKELQCA